MEIFDTTYPINTFAWLLIWICLPGTTIYYKIKDEVVFTMSGHVLSVNIQTILDSNFAQIVEEL